MYLRCCIGKKCILLFCLCCILLTAYSEVLGGGIEREIEREECGREIQYEARHASAQKEEVEVLNNYTSFPIIIEKKKIKIKEEEKKETVEEVRFPPIYVMNLARSVDRWIYAEKQMKGEGLVVERLDAVDGRALSREQLLNQSTRMAMILQPRGVIGCYLSHRKFWQLVVDLNLESAIIFEDDVQLVPGFKGKLQEHLKAFGDEKYDVVLLGAIGRVHPEGKDGVGTRMFSAYIGGTRPLKRISEHVYQPRRPAGTHAYMVSQQGARKLLYLCSKAVFHVDLDAWRHRSLVIRMFDPMLAYQTFESTSLTDVKGVRLVVGVIVLLLLWLLLLWILVVVI